MLAVQILIQLDIDKIFSGQARDMVLKHLPCGGNRWVLRADEPVYLYKTSYFWNRFATRCMKSRLSKDFGNYFVRSIEYWGIDLRSDELNFRKFSMAVNITLKKPIGAQPYIYAVRTDMTAEMELSSWEYPVLFADDVCVLTGEYGDGGTGRRACTLWVKESSLQSPPAHCDFLLLTMCSTSAYNAYNNEHPYCDVYELPRTVKPR
ncbi:hypothetical protein V5799_014654 [Amblyomma americanum]|uniref:Lipocalin n=1 Tax=Amblyomma americanum TaxID=6943 RepID=A0AAQ4E2E1_AMBAM